MLGKHRARLYPWKQTQRGMRRRGVGSEVGADNTEKQGHSAFPSLLPFRHLASTKGCYVTAIYTHTAFPSHPPSHVKQHHMQTKCSSTLFQLLFLLSVSSFRPSSIGPPFLAAFPPEYLPHFGGFSGEG